MITTITGNNSYLMKQKVKSLVSAFVSEHGDLALERLDGEEIGLPAVLDAIQSIPFLTAKKMVVLRSGTANKEIAEAIEQIISTSADSTELIIYEPSVDKRTSYYKTLKKLTEFNEYNQLSEQELASWIKDRATQLGGRISLGDAAYLVQRIGSSQEQLANELDKLLTYDNEISRSNIELLTEASPQSKIFDLLDAAFAGQGRRALGLYQEQRSQKVEPQQILAMLGWQLHALALVKAAGKRSPNAIASEAGLSPFVVRKSLTVTNRLSLERIKELVAGALEIDVNSKTKALNLDDALKAYILSI